MIEFGETLLIIGTLLLIIAGYIVSLFVGLIVTGISMLIWGTIILYIVSREPIEPNDKQR